MSTSVKRNNWLVLVVLFCSTMISAQNISSPKQEVRAVWVTTVNSLDWPKPYDIGEQKSSLREIVIKLHAAHFNTIFFQVRGRGDALYQSSYEPWSDVLTGTLGKDPGWDPLQFIIEEAHARAMEVHAWFNTFFVRSGKSRVTLTKPGHVANENPDWVQNIEGQLWLDPGIPAVRSYLVKVGMDIIHKYDVDGIHFDFIRYPGTQFPDDKSYRAFGNGMQKDNWRRENINKFVRTFYDSAIAIKPMLKIGSAPIGVYINTGSIRGLQGFSDLYQDSRRWLREKIHDYVVPQIYWSLGNQPADPDFATVVKDWTEHTFGRHVYAGIGAYKPNVQQQLPELVDISRSLGLQGNSFFRYENIVSKLDIGRRYQYPANIPAMSWKDRQQPNSPSNLSVKNIAKGIFRLNWNLPLPANDGDVSKYYNVYRSTGKFIDVNNPSNLLAILSSGETAYLDTITHAISPKYYYCISALDKGNNESLPTDGRSVIIPEIAALAASFDLRNKLGNSYPEPTSSIAYFHYEINTTLPVFLKILNQSGEELVSVVDAVQTPGRYIAAADISKLQGGTYTYMLIAGDFKEKRTLRIE